MEYTYATILASVQNYCIDSSTEYATEYPKLIQIAQDVVLKDLHINLFDTSSNVSTSTALLTKPTNLITTQSVFLLVGTERQYMEMRSRSYIDLYWANTASVGTPKYYCDDSTTQWRVAPIPDMSYTFQVNYTARLAYLTSSAQTNWLSSKYGELLFAKTMVISKAFLKEDPVTEGGELRNWEEFYQQQLAVAKEELKVSAQSSDLEMRPIVTMRAI